MTLFQKAIQKSGNHPIQETLFRENYLVALIQELSVVTQCLMDGIMCSRFMGSTGVAVQGLCNPYFSIVGIVSAILILGTQKLCVSALCRGENEKADEVFSTAVFVALSLSMLLILLFGGFAGPIAVFLGASGNCADMFEPARQYLRGLCFGTPFTVLVPVLTPIIQLNGQRRYIQVSLTAGVAVNFLLDLAAGIFGWGMFGMGIASSAAMLVSFTILAVAWQKKKTLHLRLRCFRSGTLGAISRFGLPKALKRLCNVIRPVTVNRVIIKMAGSMGLSAMSIRHGLGAFFECGGAALGAVVSVLAILFSGEYNAPALQRTKRRTYRFLLFPLAGFSVLIVIFARAFLYFYALEDAALVKMATTAVRFMALDILLYAAFESISGYWQGIGEVRSVNVIVFLVKLGFPLASVLILGRLFGTLGVWMSFSVSFLLSILAFLVPAAVKYKKPTLFPIPRECDLPPEQLYECRVDSRMQIPGYSEEIRRLCRDCGIEEERAFHIALCFEEIAVGVLENGYARSGQRLCLEFFLRIQEDRLTLRVLDNSAEFDAVAFYNTLTFDPASPESHLGIRIVMNMAEDIRYANVFGMNCLTVTA